MSKTSFLGLITVILFIMREWLILEGKFIDIL